jgi:hypothetical protein
MGVVGRIFVGSTLKTAEKAKTASVEGEQQFGKDLWKLLDANGSHPGLSDEDELRFRLVMPATCSAESELAMVS